MRDYRVIIAGCQKAELAEYEFCAEPAPGEIVGRNLVSLISTGSERGGYSQQFRPDQYPMQIGSSSIAQVLKVGEGVEGYKEGDLFFHLGYHALFVRISAEDAVRMPDGLAPEHALFGRYSAVSMTSIFRMNAKPHDKVIVTGLGLVGLMCAQVLGCLGYEAYAVDPSEERRAIAAGTTIVNVAPSLDVWPELKKGAGAMMECSGNENALRDAIPYMRPGSDIFQVGVPWKKNSEWDAHGLLYDLFYSYVSLHGGWEWYLPKKSTAFEIHGSYYHTQTAMKFIAQGKMKVVPEMYQLRDPRECNQVYSDIMVPRMKPTSMMLDWRMLDK